MAFHDRGFASTGTQSAFSTHPKPSPGTAMPENDFQKDLDAFRHTVSAACTSLLAKHNDRHIYGSNTLEAYQMLQGQHLDLQDTVRKLMEHQKDLERQLEQSGQLICHLQQRLDQLCIGASSPQPDSIEENENAHLRLRILELESDLEVWKDRCRTAQISGQAAVSAYEMRRVKKEYEDGDIKTSPTLKASDSSISLLLLDNDCSPEVQKKKKDKRRRNMS
ncbi:uncharacterized protein PV06_11539 [Exophiala oligosperma]|uniref:Uncharacterized protein n=1 Tax=Exophiala oligosperma TaxID=215243 RepID=A0A0D2D1T7_9EURO|nr:uncharacterized protein PV06_11539 [Exophiala oligosperma]KIW36175.1 hypothetical protein PV06_11539 [Exophiala oligosperma]